MDINNTSQYPQSPISGPEPQQLPQFNKNRSIIAKIAILIAVVVIAGYFVSAKYVHLWPFGKTAMLDEMASWKTYEDNRIKIKYPANWFTNGTYFSPEEIIYPTEGISLDPSAPVYNTLLPEDQLGRFNYEIRTDKRNGPDTTVKIDDLSFQKYDLIDYGTYEGESAGRVIIYLSPRLTDGKYLLFRWEEKPNLSILNGNDSQIFEKMLSTLKVKLNSAPIQTINDIFELNKKQAETQLYYSDKLGVGFTYLTKPGTNSSFTVKVSEIGHKIYVHGVNEKPEIGQSLEVFTKDPKLTLEEAIKNQFLRGYDPENCFITTENNAAINNELPLNYIAAEISFPESTDPNAPLWQNADKCPQNYSKTNGIQYFLMNREVPEKYMFIKVGQDVITLDGETDNNYNWTHSIRILK